LLKIPKVAECYAALEDIDRREVWVVWTNASHRVRGCGRQTGKKLHSEEWKRREENKRQLELNEIKYTRRKKKSTLDNGK